MSYSSCNHQCNEDSKNNADWLPFRTTKMRRWQSEEVQQVVMHSSIDSETRRTRSKTDPGGAPPQETNSELHGSWARVPLLGEDEDDDEFLNFINQATISTPVPIGVASLFSFPNDPELLPQAGDDELVASIRSSLESIRVFGSCAAALDGDEMEALVCNLQASEQLEYQAGSQIFIQGEEGDVMYVVLKGTLEAYRCDGNGENVTIKTYHNSGAFGEIALLANCKRHASVQAITDCVLLSLGRNAYHRVLKQVTERHESLAIAQLNQLAEFAKLSECEKRAIASAMHVQSFPRDTVIFEQEESVNRTRNNAPNLAARITSSYSDQQVVSLEDCLCLIESGEVTCFDVVDSTDTTQYPEKVPRLIGKGECFGSRQLADDYTDMFETLAHRSFCRKVVVNSESVTCFVLEKQHFHSLLGPVKSKMKIGFLSNVLAEVKLFQRLGLHDTEYEFLATQVETRNISKGEVIARQGDPGGIMHIIAKGLVQFEQIQSDSVAAADPVVVGRLTSGDHFGESTVLPFSQSESSDCSMLSSTFPKEIGPMPVTSIALLDTHLYSLDLTCVAQSLVDRFKQLATTSGAPKVVVPTSSNTCCTNKLSSPRKRMRSKVLEQDTHRFNKVPPKVALSSPTWNESTTAGKLSPTSAWQTQVESDPPEITMKESLHPTQLLPSASLERTTTKLALNKDIIQESQSLVKTKTSPSNSWRTHDHGLVFSIHELEPVAELGKGSFGTVLLVRHVPSDVVYALKYMKKKSIELQHRVAHVHNERELLVSLSGEAHRHPFITHLIRTFRDATAVYLLMEAALGGDLFTLLSKRKRLDKVEVQFISAQLVLALEHLHSRGVMYRDLKPENTVLCADGYIKLTDFGLAKRIGMGRTYTLCGTPGFLAPEVFRMRGHGFPVDSWALGVIQFELVVGGMPFSGEDINTIAKELDMYAMFHIQYQRDPSVFQTRTEHPVYAYARMYGGEELVDIISKLMHPDPIQRMSLHDNHHTLRGHPFFKDIEWSLLMRKQLKPPSQLIDTLGQVEQTIFNSPKQSPSCDNVKQGSTKISKSLSRYPSEVSTPISVSSGLSDSTSSTRYSRYREQDLIEQPRNPLVAQHSHEAASQYSSSTGTSGESRISNLVRTDTSEYHGMEVPLIGVAAPEWDDDF